MTWTVSGMPAYENLDISNVDIFNYLKLRLKHAALKGYQLQQIIMIIYCKIISVKKTTCCISSCGLVNKDLLRFFNVRTVHVQGLATLGIGSEQYSSILISIVM